MGGLEPRLTAKLRPGGHLDHAGLSRYNSRPTMKTAPSLLLALGVLCTSVRAQSGEFRTFTNTQGKSIQAKLLKVDATHALIQLASGQQFNLPINTLSAADQEYLKKAATNAPAAAPAAAMKFKPGPNDKIEPAALNEIVGQPVFSDSLLWQSKAEEVAERLKWKKESETKNSSSYRSYPDADYRLFGARPFSVAMYAADGMVTNLSLVYANKGDLFGMADENNNRVDRNTPQPQALATLGKAMKKDLESITATLTAKLGEPVKQTFGEGEAKDRMLRWDWRGHAILLREQENEYVGLEIVTSTFADAKGKVAMTGDKIIRERALANVEKRPNGDVVINDIPMVDQGPKGYCVPATAERAMRYLGVPADMYVLAMAGDTNLGGGTSVQLLLNGVERDLRHKGRSFDTWKGEFKLRDIQKYIDKGVPIMWGLYSTDDFNKLANDRTKARKDVTELSAWKPKLAEMISSDLRKERDQGHVVLIIGYNKDTNEIAFSDSWGERFKERWITIQEAELVSQQEYWVVSF